MYIPVNNISSRDRVGSIDGAGASVEAISAIYADGNKITNNKTSSEFAWEKVTSKSKHFSKREKCFVSKFKTVDTLKDDCSWGYSDIIA